MIFMRREESFIKHECNFILTLIWFGYQIFALRSCAIKLASRMARCQSVYICIKCRGQSSLNGGTHTQIKKHSGNRSGGSKDGNGWILDWTSAGFESRGFELRMISHPWFSDLGPRKLSGSVSDLIFYPWIPNG